MDTETPEVGTLPSAFIWIPSGYVPCTNATANTKSQEVRGCRCGWGILLGCYKSMQQFYLRARCAKDARTAGLPLAGVGLGRANDTFRAWDKGGAKVCQENADNFHTGQGSFTACPNSVRFINVRKCTRAAPSELLHHSPTAPAATSGVLRAAAGRLLGFYSRCLLP